MLDTMASTDYEVYVVSMQCVCPLIGHLEVSLNMSVL